MTRDIFIIGKMERYGALPTVAETQNQKQVLVGKFSASSMGVHLVIHMGGLDSGTTGCVTTRYMISCISSSLQIMNGKALGFSLCASSAKVHIFVQPYTSTGNQHQSLGESFHFGR